MIRSQTLTFYTERESITHRSVSMAINPLMGTQYIGVIYTVVCIPSRLEHFAVLLFSLGVPASSANCLDSLQDDSPPHWLKSLQTLTEMDVPSGSTVPSQPSHSTPFNTQMSLHRANWAPYLPPGTASAASQFHSPPPGFQTAFRPSAQPPTDLLQSAGLDRH